MAHHAKRIACFGGTFDPVHNGHLAVAKELVTLFSLDEFVFIPAFHAPHKPDIKPTNAYHRFAMLCLATVNEPKMKVSLMEIETGEKRFTLDTLTQLKKENGGNKLFFVMGADSWRDIKTWHEWEKVLLSADQIVVSRPGVAISTDHVTETVFRRVVDLRGRSIDPATNSMILGTEGEHIYLTDAVNFDVSATGIRDDLRQDGVLDSKDGVPGMVAKYIQKYELYR